MDMVDQKITNLSSLHNENNLFIPCSKSLLVFIIILQRFCVQVFSWFVRNVYVVCSHNIQNSKTQMCR